MKVLVITSPGFGHTFPVVSLAWALRAAGHEVVLGLAGANPADLPTMAAAGLPVVELATIEQITRAHRAGMAGSGLDGLSDKELRAMAREEAAKAVDGAPTFLVDKPFGALSAAVAARAVEFASWWRPDLVMHSPLQGAGPLVAAKLGVPAVEHSFALASSRETAVKLADELAGTYRRLGVTGFPERYELVNIAPPSMAIGDPGWAMRHVPYHGGAVLPRWLLATPDRPRITVTMGTILPRYWARLRPLQWITEVAGEVDAEFVLALGDVDTSALGPLPANVRTVGWVPLTALLDTSHAVIHHAGSGSTMAALVAGLPQLVIPFNADQFINARAVAKRGVGIEVDVDVETVTTDAVRRLLDDSLRAAVAEVRAEVAAMPAPADLVRRLAELR